MKSLSKLSILALASALSVAGCNAPSAQETAPVADTNTTETNQTAPANATDANATDATAAPAAKADTKKQDAPKTAAKKESGAKAAAPDPKYHVTAGSEGAGDPNYQAALAKVAVPPPPAAMKVPATVRVVMQTDKGPITLELNAKEAPLHVKSFVYLANLGFFNGTVFHRHADLLGGGKGFIIQGGDPLTKDPATSNYAGGGGPGYTIPRERNALTHQKLVIAAARTQDPDSAGSQFYLTQNAVPFLDEGDGYTVFGKVVAGADVALKLTQGDTLKKVTVEQPKAAKK